MVRRYLFMGLGFMFVALGAIGSFLPVLPTVPFMLLALGCFSQSSKRFHDWLYHHKVFGPQLQLWNKYKVIPYTAKIAALGSMSCSLAYLIFFSDAPTIAVVCAAALMLWAASFIMTKPSKIPEDDHKLTHP
ncbi:MAG: YbaN family protein [Rickettsiales bacterium]|nr:YbaN family protein [Rickettsiales bacterium]